MKKVLDLKATWILPFALAIPFSSCTKMEEVSVPDDSTPVVKPVEPSQVRTDVVRVKLNAQYAEKLENMEDTTPVWWDQINSWVLVYKGNLTTWSGKHLYAKGSNGKFYRRPPEGEV